MLNAAPSYKLRGPLRLCAFFLRPTPFEVDTKPLGTCQTQLYWGPHHVTGPPTPRRPIQARNCARRSSDKLPRTRAPRLCGCGADRRGANNALPHSVAANPARSPVGCARHPMADGGRLPECWLGACAIQSTAAEWSVGRPPGGLAPGWSHNHTSTPIGRDPRAALAINGRAPRPRPLHANGSHGTARYCFEGGIHAGKGSRPGVPWPARGEGVQLLLGHNGAVQNGPGMDMSMRVWTREEMGGK